MYFALLIYAFLLLQFWIIATDLAIKNMARRIIWGINLSFTMNKPAYYRILWLKLKIVWSCQLSKYTCCIETKLIFAVKYKVLRSSWYNKQMVCTSYGAESFSFKSFWNLKMKGVTNEEVLLARCSRWIPIMYNLRSRRLTFLLKHHYHSVSPINNRSNHFEFYTCSDFKINTICQLV